MTATPGQPVVVDIVRDGVVGELPAAPAPTTPTTTSG